MESRIYLAELIEATGMLQTLRERMRGVDSIQEVWLDWVNRRMVFEKPTHFMALPVEVCFAHMARGH